MVSVSCRRYNHWNIKFPYSFLSFRWTPGFLFKTYLIDNLLILEVFGCRFDSKRFCRDCRKNVIREFKELKELKRMRREPRCTSWFCVADTAFQYEVWLFFNVNFFIFFFFLVCEAQMWKFSYIFPFSAFLYFWGNEMFLLPL